MNGRDPLIGKVLADRFEILDRIGEGGMGVVYRARQISVDRAVAIKVLNAQVAQDPQWVQRFNNEARACSKLQHPNTVRLIDFGQTREGLLFMAMEFLDGMSLRAAIERSGRMPPARVLKILVQCCQSLAEAHAMGIIHRDIKPDNLFLTPVHGQADFVKVLDFSVAKLKQQAGSAMQTQAGIVFGTPTYMSPEQGRGLPLDARSDIYALGIVAYEMLTGRPPFLSPNPMEVLAMHVRSPVPPLTGVPDRVAHVVMRSLAKDAAQRQQTVDELLAECQATLAELSSGLPALGGLAAGGPPPASPPAGSFAEAKTLFAASAPVAPGRPASSPGGSAQPAVRTMIAPMPGSAPPGPTPVAGASPSPLGGVAMMGAPFGGTPAAPVMPAAVPAHTPPGVAQPADNPRTVLLSSSEGIVSLARHQQTDTQGASPLFWILCIAIGAAVGVAAYFVVAALTGG